MKPAPFAYHAPSTVDHATALLADLGDGATLLAGGQSLIPIMNLGLARPETVIDLGGITQLRGIDSTEDGIVIRAMTTQRLAEISDVVRMGAPMVAHALSMVGFRQTRTRGTVVGSLAHADPAAELPVVALALDATIHLASHHDERTLSADDFFVSYFTTRRRPTEVVVDVTFPSRFKGWGFAEFQRRTGDFALVSAAVAIEPSGEFRIALGGVADRPIRAREAETALDGRHVERATAERAAHIASEAAEPFGDIHGSPDFRRRLIVPTLLSAILDAARRGQADG